jgi:hypothetical protein
MKNQEMIMKNCEIIYISLWTFPFTFLLTNKLYLKEINVNSV